MSQLNEERECHVRLWRAGKINFYYWITIHYMYIGPTKGIYKWRKTNSLCTHHSLLLSPRSYRQRAYKNIIQFSLHWLNNLHRFFSHLRMHWLLQSFDLAWIDSTSFEESLFLATGEALIAVSWNQRNNTSRSSEHMLHTSDLTRGSIHCINTAVFFSFLVHVVSIIRLS
jgi:hypothetical protein